MPKNNNKFVRKYTKSEGVNQYLDFLIDPSFQGVNRLFVLSFQNEGSEKVHTGYYNVMIDGKKIFDQPVKNYIRTYENIRKISTGQEDDCTTGCLLGYNYFKEHYKMIAIDLSKQQELDSDLKSIQQINFTGNLENQSITFFTIEEDKETVLDFLQETVKVF